MKKKLYLAGMLILAAALWGCGGEKKPESPYGEDGKLRKDVTLEEIRSIEKVYGDLIEVSYFHGGGMEGSSHDTMLTKEKDGSCLIRTRDAGSISFPRIIREYTADGSVFTELQQLIEKDNLALWEALPFDEEFMVMDAPSTHLTFIYDESAQGGYSYKSYTIDYDNVLPEGAGDILRSFTTAMLSGISPENLRDEYFEIDGERVRTGRDADLTDMQISGLVSGYWRETGTDTGISLYTFGLGDTLEYTLPEDGLYTEKFLTVRETVRAPWKDADTSFYVSLEDEEGQAWVMYLEKLSLILEREDGSEMHLLERQD